ncbi:MAG: biosynthetic-type acetolactate synthase large subunit [Aigarchaeota archaeon]|nr:biosynthetic-type acetolactate synthase large subunit [Aigarchaeota archaeon]MCX8192764.1 biosynthetic-type acetolactate synthase large subunit [Nitrososphaeria archaeon]MDW7986011.1 biosynthetic-type acetolactate synthase large subunit [Nitrososphaerota archaeon]
MVEMSGAKALIETLKNLKVEVIFGIPGGAIMPVYDELRDSGIRHILTRHEQHAAHMADGYARAIKRPGVCMATSGPGSTNLITGIANAFMDSSPIVALTGQVATTVMGMGAFQETDMIGLTTHITKWSYQVKSVKEIPRAVKTAFKVAASGRMGPVVVDFPRDIQVGSEDVDLNEKPLLSKITVPPPPDPLVIKKIVNELLESERPIILAGGGVKWARAERLLLELAERLLIPIATTFMGKGVVPETHPLSLRCVGMHGNPVAHEAIINSDLILILGARLSDRTTCKIDEFGSDSKIIHIDIDPSEIGKNKEVYLGLVASLDEALKAILEALDKLIEKKEKTAWLNRVKEIINKWDEIIGDNGLMGRTDIALIFKALRRAAPPNTIVTTEVGQNQMWSSVFWRIVEPDTFISSGGLGTMGFGFPAAIGAKVARPECPVMDIAGDGSFLMNENNLAVVATENIPVVVVILDNRMLGMVAQWQRMFYGRRYMAVQFKDSPNFVKLAEAYGVEGVRAESPQEVERTVSHAIRNNIPMVVDVPINPEADVLPFVPAGRSFKDIIIPRK